MNLNEIRNEGNKYILNIEDEIYNAANIVQDIRMLENACVSELTVRINSLGGRVFEGYKIVTEIMDSKMETTAEVTVAMSIAGVIAMSCDKVIMKDYGILMLHNPFFEGGKEMTDSELDLIDKVKSTIVKIYTNRTNLGIDSIIDMMDRESYLTAEEAFELGMIDDIKTSEKKSELANKYAMIVNKLKNKDSIMKEDNKEVEETVDETVETTETETTETVDETVENTDEEVEETTDEVEETNTEKVELETKLAEYEAKIAEYETKEELELENRVKAVLNEHKDNLTEKEYTKWVELGKEDLDFVKNSFSKLVNKTTSKVEVESKEEADNGLIDIKEMARTNPTKLKNIKETNPVLYKASFKETYGVELED